MKLNVDQVRAPIGLLVTQCINAAVLFGLDWNVEQVAMVNTVLGTVMTILFLMFKPVPNA